MRGVQHFEVRDRVDANHRVATLAVARPVEPKWPIRLRIAFITGSTAALWIAAYMLVRPLI